MILRAVSALITVNLCTNAVSFATTDTQPTSPSALSPCPESPNCVLSSTDPKDQDHFIEPFELVGTPKDTMAKIKSLIEATPRTRITSQTANYIHAEFTSLIFRFVDDVEFLYDPKANLVQVRSASRIGYSDLGANRKRIELLREAFKK